jgi:hypothetical protein
MQSTAVGCNKTQLQQSMLIIMCRKLAEKKSSNFYMSPEGIPSLCRINAMVLSKSFACEPMCFSTLLSNKKVRHQRDTIIVQSQVVLLMKLFSSVEEVRNLEILSKKFDIYCKVTKGMSETYFVQHPDIVVLLHPFRVSNFSVNFFCSAEAFYAAAGCALATKSIYA